MNTKELNELQNIIDNILRILDYDELDKHKLKLFLYILQRKLGELPNE